MRLQRRAALGIHEPLLLTLTSAVGVLVIPLALMQMRASDSPLVNRRAAPGGSAQDFARQEKLLEVKKSEIAHKQQDVQVAEASIPESRRKLAANRKEISALQSLPPRKLPTEEEMAALEKVGAAVAVQRKRVDELKSSVASAESRNAELRASIAGSQPRAAAPPPIEITPPNPRPAPANWEVVEFVCRNGRVAPLNEDGLRKIAQTRINRAESTLSRPDGIDCEALVELFNEEVIGTPHLRLHVEVEGNKPKLRIEHRENSGETPEEFGQPTSKFQKILRQLEARRHWIRFRVYPDSFETYLEARGVVGKIPAGWQPTLESAPYLIDLDLAGALACGGKAPAQPLKPEAEKPKGDEKEFRVKKALSKISKNRAMNEAAKKAAAKNSEGGEQPKDASAGKPSTKFPKVEVPGAEQPQAKVEQPQTVLRPPVPNDDID